MICVHQLYTHIRGGGKRAVTELSFGHVTTKTWAYSGGCLDLSEKIMAKKSVPPTSITF